MKQGQALALWLLDYRGAEGFSRRDVMLCASLCVIFLYLQSNLSSCIRGQ